MGTPRSLSDIFGVPISTRPTLLPTPVRLEDRFGTVSSPASPVEPTPDASSCT